MDFETKKSDPKVSWVIQKCFPAYSGKRSIKVRTRNTYNVSDYWSDGSRNYVAFLDLNSRALVSMSDVGFEKQAMANPFNLNIGDVSLRPGICAVEHCIFCGKDLGIRIYIHEEDAGKFQ